jgi:hypothetical protein
MSPAALFNEPGSGILTRGFPRKPPGLPSFETAIAELCVSAAFKPLTAILVTQISEA